MFLPSTIIAGVSLLCLTYPASASTVSKRQSSAVFVPNRVELPLQFASSGRYVLPVKMGGGDNPQDLTFTISTGSGVTFVGGNNCASCEGIPLYNQAASANAKPVTTPNGTANWAGDGKSGSVIKETCALTTSTGSPWNYANQSIVVLNQTQTNSSGLSPLFSGASGVSGIVGLGTNRQLDPSTGFQPGFADTIFSQWLTNNPTALNFTFGMNLKAPSDNMPTTQASALKTQDGGNLDWLQADQAKYMSNTLQWKNVVTSPSTQTTGTGGQDWTISMDGFVFASGANKVTNSQSITAQVDPLYPNLYLPLAQATLLNAAIQGSVEQPKVSTLGSQSTAWVIPCDAKFSLGFVVGFQTFTLDPSSLIVKDPSSGACMSPIEGWTDTSVNQYMLGGRFASSVYLIFQVNRDGSQTIGFATRSVQSASKSIVGPIVGGVVGGIGGIIIICGLVFWYVRRRRHLKKNSPGSYDGAFFENKPESEVVPFTLGAPSSPSATPSNIASTQYSGTMATSLVSASALGDENRPDANFVLPPAYEDSEASYVGSSSRVNRTPVDRKTAHLRTQSVAEETSPQAGASDARPSTSS